MKSTAAVGPDNMIGHADKNLDIFYGGRGNDTVQARDIPAVKDVVNCAPRRKRSGLRGQARQSKELRDRPQAVIQPEFRNFTSRRRDNFPVICAATLLRVPDRRSRNFRLMRRVCGTIFDRRWFRLKSTGRCPVVRFPRLPYAVAKDRIPGLMENAEIQEKMQALRERVDEVDPGPRPGSERAGEHRAGDRLDKIRGCVPLFDPKREEEILQRVESYNEGPIYDNSMREIFELVLHRIRDLEIQRGEFYK